MATLYGHAMSPLEARGIVSEVATVAGRIDRALKESQYEGLPEDQQRADLRAYWQSLFDQSLDSVLTTVAAHHFHDTPEAREHAERWKSDLAGRTTELLMYGFLQNPDFLTLATDNLSLLSSPAEIVNPAEKELTNSQALRRLELLESFFQNHPHINSAMQSLYVRTEAHGVVALVRYRLSSSDDYQYAIGLNIQNASGDTAGFVFDHQGHASPLRLVNSVGVTAKLKPGFVPPTADQLCNEFVDAVINDSRGLKFDPPAEANVRWFA